MIYYFLIGIFLAWVIDVKGGQHFTIPEKLMLITLWPIFIIAGIIETFKS